ncbi:unnamed protein product [Rhizophagus irregularis]|nr:unnamed protein product [Rhizophagus irregularis]
MLSHPLSHSITETVEDEEPPPPYDNSTETKPSFTIFTSPSQQDYPATQTDKPSLTISTSPSQQDYQLLNQYQHIYQQIQLHNEDNSVFIVAIDFYVANHLQNDKISVMIAEAEAAERS